MSECQALLLFTLKIKAISRLDEALYLNFIFDSHVSNPDTHPAALMTCRRVIISQSVSVGKNLLCMNLCVCARVCTQACTYKDMMVVDTQTNNGVIIVK